MRKLNNKGYMLVEIIMAFAITFGLVYFLMDIVIDVKNSNDDLLVETIVKTDQTIITNKLMEYAIELEDKFDCGKLEVASDGKSISYNGDVLNVIDKYVTIKPKTYCESKKGKVSIRIPVEIKQMSDKKFDITIDYKYDLRDTTPPECEFGYGGNMIYADCKDNDGGVGIDYYGPNDTYSGTSTKYIKSTDLLAPGKYKYYASDKAGNKKEFEVKVTTCIAANAKLDEGMIPVTISKDGTVKTISQTNNDWCNYNEGQWANVVLVNKNATEGAIGGSHPREYYMENNGVIVNPTDILAYFVYIPRFRYKVYVGKDSDGVFKVSDNPETINIYFQDKNFHIHNEEKDTFITHPAFTFGDEEIDGFWIGKFETSTVPTSTCYTSPSEANCNNANQEPRILPNVMSLRWQNVSNKFKTALKFANRSLNTDGKVTFNENNENSVYGLTKNSDSHLIKNSEWGAVAYLSHSIYGINDEIYINNSSSHYTGRSGGNVGGSVNTLATQFPESSTSTNQYNASGYYTWIGQPIGIDGTIGTVTDFTLGTKASTTGNITGVYDLSGGGWEAVMGNWNNVVSNSEFKSSQLTSSDFKKYYDLYAGTRAVKESCNGGYCFGHALGETYGWYNDVTNFFNSNNSNYTWLNRGGRYLSGSEAGAFAYQYFTGTGGSDYAVSYAMRVVLTID